MTIKTTKFDAAKYLDTDKAIAAFLADALESGDAEVFQEALNVAARARGIAEIAKAAGLGRESLYKALRPDATPRFDTVQRVMTALGVKITLTPA
jgi:probable addiction module antidote protein